MQYGLLQRQDTWIIWQHVNIAALRGVCPTWNPALLNSVVQTDCFAGTAATPASSFPCPGTLGEEWTPLLFGSFTSEDSQRRRNPSASKGDQVNQAKGFVWHTAQLRDPAFWQGK